MASMNDRFTETTNGTRPSVAILSTQKETASQVFHAESLGGWATATAVHFIVYRKDSQGKKIPGSQTDWKGIVDGADIVQIQLKAGNNQIYPVGSVIEAAPTAAWADDLVEGLAVEHKADGSHKDIHADSVDTVNRIKQGGNVLLPAGNIMPTAAINIPAGWLECNGQELGRSTFNELFAAIGDIYGVGNGTTTFNLPDLRGRTIFGLDQTQGEFTNRGQKGGQKDVQAHSHTMGRGNDNNLGGGYGWQATDDKYEAYPTNVTGSGVNNLNPYMTLRWIIKA